ncbi:hypothetical protein CANCADRAFT_25494 [Tortispora caseinolytica NRRL Y-17796]|uniref:Peptide hydrolase n=1 Tax=Tortispora caseinolytica NRRL Y-17796 TaxID=767744 RepID=A0A1E4TH69_9ASCO|nr:hypothetical protein CANCADRAFT_25494 [Tortispora caseinolytica NRRL Y-17796]
MTFIFILALLCSFCYADKFTRHRFPTQLSYNDTVSNSIDQIDLQRMYLFVASITSCHNRYYISDSGSVAVSKLIDLLNPLISANNFLSIETVEHPWKQKSVIVKWNTPQKETVVLGSHIDSSSHFFPSRSFSPGADDNASGMAALFEVLNVLLQVQFKPNRNIEFHFYSAEESGLKGSQQIFQHYSRTHKNIISMVQFDTIGIPNPHLAPHMAVVTDNASPPLVQFLRMIAQRHSTLPLSPTKCRYACSDHASANKFKFPSALITESKLLGRNWFVHSTADTIDHLDFNHIAEAVKIALGYTIELAT